MRGTIKKLKFTYIKITLLVMFCYALIGRGYVTFQETGDNFFHILVNGQEVGVLGEVSGIDDMLVEARRNIAGGEEGLVFLEAEVSYVGEEVLWGEIDEEGTVLANMEKVLRSAVQEPMRHSYTVKVDEYMVNLASAEEVCSLLQAAVNRYDKENKFAVELVHDSNREFSVLTTQVIDQEQKKEEEQTQEEVLFPEGGIQAAVTQSIVNAQYQGEKDFDDYELGLLSLDFSEKVEVVEAYLPQSQLKTVDQAIEEITREQELKSVYKVESGDTLTEISLKVNIPMEQIIAMNDILEDENSILHIGDELTITVPEPELSVVWQEENYYEETYDADVVYIENDNWYTNQSEVRQQPSAGFRKTIAITSYINDQAVSREIVKEEVVKEAVAKIVERGTKVPPTYIRPISGGRKTSGFGPRKRPTKGASTYHKGVDLATPTGTAVKASCGGTVAKAGWGGASGYVVYINHEDGKQTRYAHLSKILVKVGQKVKQGEKIALSGNTGVTTGPHLHFEILVNGKQVDPMKYIK